MLFVHYFVKYCQFTRLYQVFLSPVCLPHECLSDCLRPRLLDHWFGFVRCLDCCYCYRSFACLLTTLLALNLTVCTTETPHMESVIVTLEEVRWVAGAGDCEGSAGGRSDRWDCDNYILRWDMTRLYGLSFIGFLGTLNPATYMFYTFK